MPMTARSKPLAPRLPQARDPLVLTKSKFTKTSKWEEISLGFCRFHGLPNGSSIKISYKAGPGPSRIQKSNTKYQRAKFNKSVMTRASADGNVGTLIDQHLLPNIDIDLKSLKAEILAFGPYKEPIGRGTKIKTWRNMDPEPTPEQLEEQSDLEYEIDEISKEANSVISSLNEFRSDPEATVLPAVLRALIWYHGHEAVQNALTTERGKK